MFVRFRQTARRLQVSLVETHRIEGRVRHEHVASLGSVPREPTTADRITFWEKLHQRLDTLGNRIDTSQRQSILGAIYARIPARSPTDMEIAARLGSRTKTDRKYDAMLTEIVRRGGGNLANKLCTQAVKRAERRTIKLVWDYMQVLIKEQQGSANR
jgi:hypothetical protein